MSRRRRTVISVAGSQNSCERIRPERSRNPIQRLVWGPGLQFHIGQTSIANDETSNPRIALRRLLRLYEGRQYREAAGFLMKLQSCTLKATLPDIPIDLLIDTLPHSLALLEALYSRLVELNLEDKKNLRIEQLLWRVVNLISTSQDQFRLKIWCKLLMSLNRLLPTAKSMLLSKRKALERAVEGLGKHGLVPSYQANTHEGFTAANLVPLSVALKEELEIRTEIYKLALSKIEALTKHTSIHKDQAVQAASHQRQLSLRYGEIQQRLIDNQSILNTLEKAGRTTSLENLLAELKQRIEQDKEVLRQWTALRKSSLIINAKNPPLAPKLLQYSKACGIVLQLINDENNTQLSHTEENLEDFYEEESSSAGYHTDESYSPTPEPMPICTTIINNGNNDRTINYFYQRYNHHYYHHHHHHHHQRRQELFNNLQVSDLSMNQRKVERLTERYAALYTHAYLHTLDALDTLVSLKDVPDLKAKILYSIIVLTWRVTSTIQTSRRFEALKALNGGDNDCCTDQMGIMENLEDCLKEQMANYGIKSGQREVSQQVVKQLEKTLYDFPCLKACSEIKIYAETCANLAWVCLARKTPLVLNVEDQSNEFQKDLHIRHHASPNSKGTTIQTVLWPGLREGYQGSCLHRAIVLTI